MDSLQEMLDTTVSNETVQRSSPFAVKAAYNVAMLQQLTGIQILNMYSGDIAL